MTELPKIDLDDLVTVAKIKKTLKNNNKQSKKKFQLAPDGISNKIEDLERIKEGEREVIKLLRNPNFLDLCIKEVQKKVVGEYKTILTILICANGRNVINHNLASYNLLINDVSGAGKDFVTRSVCELLPENQFVYRTKITPELFTYWHNPRLEPDWTWDGKVFYLEDAPSKIINSEVFKVMASKGSKATVLIKQAPIDIEIRGKPVIFVTSANANLNNENLRRFPIVNLDSSEDQTYLIMKRKGELAKTGEEIEYDEKIKRAISYLRRVRVVVPYADKLADFFPKNIFMRTHFERFIDYIKASASFFQYQREKNEDGHIIANEQDYEIARIMLKKTTSNPAMIPLTKDQQRILNFFTERPYEGFAVGDIEDRFPFSDRWLRKQLDLLFSFGFLDKDKEEREGVKQKVIVYCYNKDKHSIDIPEWKDLNNISLKECSKYSKHSFDSNHSNDSKLLPVATGNTFESIEQESNEHNLVNNTDVDLQTKLRMIFNFYKKSRGEDKLIKISSLKAFIKHKLKENPEDFYQMLKENNFVVEYNAGDCIVKGEVQ